MPRVSADLNWGLACHVPISSHSDKKILSALQRTPRFSMDGDDWDLHAVVRGYTAAAANSTAVIASDDNDNDDDAPLSSLSNVSYHQTTLDYSGVENTDAPCLQGLREICRDVYVDPPVPVSVPVARALHTPLVENQLLNSNSFQIGGPPPSRPRRRKTQPMKMVSELTQEELAADPWAWRKYGQKPIKGSSYPRSYYRCSTSKCCLAKKHVERSPNDPSLFLVSYTGEHTHPRPAQRSTPSSSSSAAATKIPPSPPSASNITAEEDNGSGGGAAATEQTVLDGMAVVTNCDAMLFHPFSDTGDDELFSSAMISSPRWSPSSSTAANGGGEEEKGF